jgi:hypothetical protein
MRRRRVGRSSISAEVLSSAACDGICDRCRKPRRVRLRPRPRAVQGHKHCIGRRSARAFGSRLNNSLGCVQAWNLSARFSLLPFGITRWQHLGGMLDGAVEIGREPFEQVHELTLIGVRSKLGLRSKVKQSSVHSRNRNSYLAILRRGGTGHDRVATNMEQQLVRLRSQAVRYRWRCVPTCHRDVERMARLVDRDLREDGGGREQCNTVGFCNRELRHR